MHQATRGWDVYFLGVLLFLSSLVSGCASSPRESPTPQSTAQTSADVAAPTTVPEASQVETGGTAVIPAERPQKPQTTLDPATAGGPDEVTPRPTADAALDDWTILIYMSAGVENDAAALQTLNEIEAAGEGDRINVVVQFDRNAPPQTEDDWQGARRMQMEGDELPTVSSPFIDDLGAINMGDPDSLTAFIMWGQEQFPANHTALILWGEGRGWRGLMQDAGAEDDLSLADLTGALERARLGTDEPALDVLAFGEGLTGSLEVLSAVQPFARYAVASPGLLSPGIWDYEAFLGEVNAQQPESAAQFAQVMMVSALRPSINRRPVVDGLTAVDLSRLPVVQEAFSDLAQWLTQNAAQGVVSVARAHQSAQIMTLDGAAQDNLFMAMDVARFAQFLAEQAPSQELARRSRRLASVVTEAVGDASGAGETVKGLSVAWLPPVQLSEAGYGQAVGSIWPGAEDWLTAQRALHEAALTLMPIPQGEVLVQKGEQVGIENPALLGLTLRALHLDGASFVGLQTVEEGRSRLLFTKPLAPNGAQDSPSTAWPDGVTQRELIWNATAPYVSDGANGAFTPLWTDPRAGGYVMALAQYLPPEEGAAPRDVLLFFDRESRQLVQIWQSGQQTSPPGPVAPENGARLQLTDVYIDADDALRYEPGVTLVYSDALQIHYELFPLPSGDYGLGLLADGAMGPSLVTASELAVVNDEVTPGYQTYLNTRHGFQFHYPVDWPEPVFDGRQVSTAARQRGPGLTVSLYTDAGRQTAITLKREALDSFGTVDLLYDEDVLVGGNSGLLTAYGYDGGDGPHTGVLITFTDQEQETGFVVDVDGLALDEARTLEIANQLVSSWRFTPIRSGNWPDQWLTTDLNILSVTLPSSYAHTALENGWERFTDGSHFLAIRADNISGRGAEMIGQHWLEIASRGVEAFAVEEARSRLMGGAIWSEATFQYEDDGETIAGVILSTIYGEYEIVAWVEAPGEVFDALWNEQFLFAIAGSLPDAPGSAGVMLDETFDEPGAWGVGEQDGATGAVREGVYELDVSAPRGFFWTSNGLALRDGTFGIDAVQTDGTLDAGYGLLLRADSEAQSFYVFEISADGYVWVGWCQDNCAWATTLAGDGWLPSEAIVQGLNATNRLRVEADGARLVFYVNDIQVATVEDEHAAAGEVGLFVETLGEGGVAVQFDNLRATTP